MYDVLTMEDRQRRERADIWFFEEGSSEVSIEVMVNETSKDMVFEYDETVFGPGNMLGHAR